MSVRFRICLTAWIAVVVLSALADHAGAQTLELKPVDETAPTEVLPQVDDDWVIDIRPASKVISAPVHGPVAVNAEGEPIEESAVDLSDYARIYKSIPFNRAEYNVNPSYRHDSTMEILTGNARHQTIVRHTTTTRQPNVSRRAYSGLPANPSAYGYLRPALRLNYYRHFPSLNPYVNIWNYSGAF